MRQLGLFERIESLIKDVEMECSLKNSKALQELRDFLGLLEKNWSEYLDHSVENAFMELLQVYKRKPSLERFRLKVFCPEQERVLKEQAERNVGI